MKLSGNVTIYCHYFNNDEDCPFDDQSIFAHEESPKWMFGRGCERMKCMFQHEEHDQSDEESCDESDADD